tara:strand:+ start:1641 stop:1754 length:114 start_codon:yes stop_codon:yes gene_type:complete
MIWKKKIKKHSEKKLPKEENELGECHQVFLPLPQLLG